MTDKFEWNDAYALGFNPMDDTHKEFVELVQHLRTCKDDELLGYLDKFAAHGEAHFSQEDAWMRETSFPAAECHIDEHAAVLASVHGVRGLLIEKGDTDNVRRLAQALADWFPGHADYLDSALAQWMVKKQLGAIPVVVRRNLKFDEPLNIGSGKKSEQSY